jgi:hypothetical protein
LRQIGVAIEWPARHGDARIITITSRSADPCKFASPSSHASQVDMQLQTATNQNKGLRQDDSDERGRKRDAGGTQEGRNVQAFASHDKRLNALPNTPGFGTGDDWDANSADLSSLQQPRDVSDGNAAQAESNVNFQSSPARQEEHASDSDRSTASAPETENRPMWRHRL